MTLKICDDKERICGVKKIARLKDLVRRQDRKQVISRQKVI